MKEGSLCSTTVLKNGNITNQLNVKEKDRVLLPITDCFMHGLFCNRRTQGNLTV